MRLVTDDVAVHRLEFCHEKKSSLSGSHLESLVIRQLEAYFAHERLVFELPLKLSGTAFQMKAWQYLETIPYAQTISYQQQLQALGYQSGAQAIGQANKRNPIQIIIPCHRVICSNGSLGGYEGGLDKKIWLLSHENSRTID